MAKEKEIVGQMVRWLLERDVYLRTEAQALWPSHPALFGARITKAEDMLRRMYFIEFRPDQEGRRVRADHIQSASRADRSFAAGIRKLQRGVDKMRAAAAAAPPEEQASLQRRADHRAFQVTAAKVRNRKRLDP